MISTMRRVLSSKIWISSRELLDCINHADFFRIQCVGEEYADLLEAVGVDTISDLSIHGKNT